MNNLSITACSFYIKKQNSKSVNKIYNLNSEIEYSDDSDNILSTTVKDMFISFSNNCSVAKKDNIKQKTFSCKYLSNQDIITDTFECLSFEIQSGYYGSVSTIVDADTREEKYIMTPNDVAEKKFYMFVVIPKDNTKVKVDKGMMIFQNIGVFGVKTITYERISHHFADKYDITLKCLTISPELFIRKILVKENLKKMIMIKNHKSNDATDNYYTGFGTESRIIGNLCFDDTMWNKIMNSINYFIKGKANLFEFQSVEYDKLKLEVMIGEKTRIINLHNIENLSIIESIPNTIQNLDGYADIDRLRSHITLVISDYLKEMVLRIK